MTATWTASIESGDTASAADLATTTTGEVEFDENATTANFTVPVNDDTTDEDNETFTVTLSGVSSNAQLAADPTAKGTIIDDDTAPEVDDVEVTSTPVLETDTYGAGERIEVSVTFTEAVNATSNTDFVLSMGRKQRMPLVDGSGTDTLVFGYTVAPGDVDDDGVFIGKEGVTLVGDRDGNPQAGEITSVATGVPAHIDHVSEAQPNHKVDGTRSIRTVEVISTPVLETDTYGAGETIRFRVTFNVAVDGDPVFTFALDGGESRSAAHETGGGTTALVFGYTVVSGDTDANGIFLWDEQDFDNPDGPVRLDSDDEIEFKDTSTDVPLYWSGRGTQSGHKVDGSRTTGNTAPYFTSSATFDAAENQTAAGTVVAADDDTDDSVTGYEITGGADQALFEIGATTGELTFKSPPNYEDPQDSGTDNGYEVTVQATSGTGTREMTADQTITVTVTNVNEKSAKPDKPVLAAVSGSTTSLTATWTKPGLNGGPDITGYALQYKESTESSWTDFAHTGTGVTTTITGLTEDTSYQARVLAKNGETDSDWSDASDAVSTNAETATPTCTLDTAAGDIWCGVLTVGAVSAAQDGFADPMMGGLSDTTFSVESGNYTIVQLTVENSSSAATPGTLIFGLDGVLTAADKARLVLHVDGSSDTFAFSVATEQSFSNVWTGTSLDWSSETFVTLRLRLAPEAPGKPTNLMADADGGTRIELSWTAPADDGGSAITGYRIEVSPDGSSGSWSELVDDTGNDATSYTHEGLSPGETRHYRVSAINAEGTSVASDSDSATTAAAGTCMLNPGDLWCGVVTVGSRSDYFGYDFQPTPVVGGLSDDDFEVGTNSYTIWAIFVGAGTWLNPGSLNFTFASNTRPSAADRDNLVLHVGSAAYRFSDVTPVAGRAFEWTDAGLDWSSETSVTLRLREREDPAADASLSALTVTHSGGTVALSPAFAPETVGYTASVANAVAEVTVAAEANAAGATLAYLDGDGNALPDADTGTPGREVALEVGVETLVQVKVTATDGDATRTYRVTVTRRAVDAPGEEGEFRLNPDMEEPYEDPAQDRYGGKQSRLEVFHAGRWGTVCSDRFKGSDTTTHPSHGNLAPKLACQAMNYDDGEYASGYGTSEPHQSEADQDNYLRPGGAYPADGPLPIWLDDVMCWTRADWPFGDDPTPDFGRLMYLENPDDPEDQTLTPYLCAYAGWGLHNGTHREDAGVRCWYISEQSAQDSERALKGHFLLSPEQHDGSNRVTVKVAFSEPIDETPEGLRNHGVRVEGGEVTAVHREGGQPGTGTRSAGGPASGQVVWVIEIQPTSAEDLTLSLDGGRPCHEAGAICTADGRTLSKGISTTVKGPSSLTASFQDVPETHDGETPFTFRVAFSEDIDIGLPALREDAFTVTGGTVTNGQRVDDRHDLFEVRVEPNSGGDVTITLPAGRDCSVSGAICTTGKNQRLLSNSPTAKVAGPANTPPTGAPTISGTAQVGETLTAGITGIADADGLSGETFAYQWVSGDGTADTDIENATDSTYTLVEADQGKAIKVRVTFTDGGGNEETLTSAPTAPVWGDGPPGAPRNLAATPGNKEVTLSWESPADNGNAPATGYRIEWRVDGKDYDKNIWGTARSMTYTTNDQANLANGVKYFFRVKAGNGSGYSYGPYGPASGEVSATPTSGSAVDLGTPVLSNTENLHHGMVQLDWEDVEDAGWYVVQYYHLDGGGGEWVDLPAAGVDIAFHGSSAVVSNLHGLSWLRVRAMSCAGASEWSQIEQLFGTNVSDWEGVPVPEVAEGDEIEPCPVVLGTPVLSDTETLHHGMAQLDWEDIEDAGWYVVQYYHVDGGSGEWLDLPAAGVDIAFHGSSAVVSNLHGLSWLRVRAMSCAGESEWSQIEQLFGTNASDWEGVPVPEVAEGDEIEPCSEDADTPDNSPATGAPTIGGTAQVGETLTSNTSGIADADGLTNVSFTYQWLADDTDIAGASGSTYTLTDSEESKAIKVEVSFTDDAGNDETLTTAATDAVAAASTPNSPATGAPTISGTIQVGETLTADTSGVSDADGLSSVQYEYQWLADDSDISGATSATYTLTDSEESKAITVQVSFTDDADNEETLTSAATDVVAGTQPTEPPDKPKGLSATASHGSVTLTWDDPGDDSITGYVILRRIPGVDPQGHFDELVANTGTAATTYTDDTVSAETRYTYRIKAINGAGTSERSRWYHIDTPAAPVPDKPTGLKATESDGQVVLTWDDPGDDSITGYVILRRVRENDTGGDFSVLVADTGSAATTYTDDTVAANTTYTYRIKAINEHGTSERSRWYHIDIPAAP